MAQRSCSGGKMRRGSGAVVAAVGWGLGAEESRGFKEDDRESRRPFQEGRCRRLRPGSVPRGESGSSTGPRGIRPGRRFWKV